VGPSVTKFCRGVCCKFGEGIIRLLTTGIGGLAYAIYSLLKVAFVVLDVVSVLSVSALFVLQLDQTKGSRAAAAYKEASRVAYCSVSSIMIKGSMLGTFMLLYYILALYGS
jgi:hypothetical protein